MYAQRRTSEDPQGSKKNQGQKGRIIPIRPESGRKKVPRGKNKRGKKEAIQLILTQERQRQQIEIPFPSFPACRIGEAGELEIYTVYGNQGATV